MRRNSKIWAHDEYDLCKVGDMVRAHTRRLLVRLLRGPARGSRTHAHVRALFGCVRQVRIEPCRALSKRKSHVVAEIVKKEDGSEPPTHFPKW